MRRPTTFRRCCRIAGGVRVAFFAALGASLSCTTPLAEAAPAGAGSPPDAPSATVQELSAQLTWFRRDSVGPSHYRIEVQAVDGLGNPVALAPLAWVTASPLDSVDGPAAAGPDGRAQLEWRARSAGGEMSLLEIRSGERAVVRLAAVGEQVLSGAAVPVAGVRAIRSGRCCRRASWSRW